MLLDAEENRLPAVRPLKFPDQLPPSSYASSQRQESTATADMKTQVSAHLAFDNAKSQNTRDVGHGQHMKALNTALLTSDLLRKMVNVGWVILT